MSWSDIPRNCAANGCHECVEHGQLMCKAHWLALPKPLRDQIWSTWRAFNRRWPNTPIGREGYQRTMAAYRDAVRAAVAYLEAVPSRGGQQAVRSVEIPSAASRRDQIDWVYEQRKRDIVRLYRGGKSARAIGQAVSLSHVRVLQILNEAGEPRRKSAANSRQASKALAEAIAAAHPERVAG